MCPSKEVAVDFMRSEGQLATTQSVFILGCTAVDSGMFKLLGRECRDGANTEPVEPQKKCVGCFTVAVSNLLLETVRTSCRLDTHERGVCACVYACVRFLYMRILASAYTDSDLLECVN